MQICSLNLLNNTSLNQTRNLTKNSEVQLQAQRTNNVSYPKISPQQYMAMKGISFGQSDSNQYDKEASLQLIKDIIFLKEDDKAALKSILERIDNPNIDVNSQGDDGTTALMVAASKGNTEIVEELLKRDDIDVNSQGDDGTTALMEASQHGHTEVVEKLLAHPDINVNRNLRDGYTALMLASANGHPEVVEKLLKHKDIDVNKTSIRRCHNGFILSSDSMCGLTALMLASRHGHTEVVEKLLAHPDINVNKKNLDGYTALMLASKNNHPEVVKKLLAHKDIDVNKASEMKVFAEWNALMLALAFNNTEIVELIKNKMKQQEK